MLALPRQAAGFGLLRLLFKTSSYLLFLMRREYPVTFILVNTIKTFQLFQLKQSELVE